jgi:hypothetical protein
MDTSLEFYPTPDAFTRYLFRELAVYGVVGELSCGDGAIVRAASSVGDQRLRRWITNDLDPRWPADHHYDATDPRLYDVIERQVGHSLDWNITNPAFSVAPAQIALALTRTRVGVAMHLRNSIHEPLKGPRRRKEDPTPREAFWLTAQPPTGLLFLPRFAFQRSATTGKWSTDSVASCWCIWLKVPARQFIKYADAQVLDELAAETPAYRARLDALMGKVAA